MSFKYKRKTTPGLIKKVHAAYMENVRNTIIERLTLIGWEFVKMARERVSYNDITGNLRSSIGFVVVDHGEIVYGDFELAKKGTDRESGLRKAKKFTKELANKYNYGYALIVVAGMDYAASVENKGKDVITGSSLIAEALLNKALAKLRKKLSI